MKDYRDMSIAEAIAWGLAPGMDGEPLPTKSDRARRWERRKSKRSK